jgi:hypothetical protein
VSGKGRSDLSPICATKPFTWTPGLRIVSRHICDVRGLNMLNEIEYLNFRMASQ